MKEWSLSRHGDYIHWFGGVYWLSLDEFSKGFLASMNIQLNFLAWVAGYIELLDDCANYGDKTRDSLGL